MSIPSAIIFINNGVNLDFLNTLKTDTGIEPNELVPGSPSQSAVAGIDVQLQITETMWFDEFNARVTADPNYPAWIHLNGSRILVILRDFQCMTHRNLADIILFVKQGVASVEKNKFEHHSPPGVTFDIQRLNIWNLTHAIRDSNVATFNYPFPGYLPPPQTQTKENPRPHEHMDHRRLRDLGTLELFGVEAMESQHGPQDSAFGGKIGGGGDDGEGGDGGEV